MFCGSGGSKSRLAKAAGAEPSGRMRDEKLHAAVARSSFWSQNVKSTSCSEHLWKLRCKKCTPSWREAHLEAKMSTAPQHRTAFASWDVKKCTPLWREAHFQVKMVKPPHVRTTFGRSSVVFCGSGDGFCTVSKVSQMCGFSKTMAGVGCLKRTCKDTCRLAGAVQETCPSDIWGGHGADFSERGCILEHQICRFARMILCDRCSTSYDLPSLFRLTHSLETWDRRNAKRIGTRPSALHTTCHFWMSKVEEVSQDCLLLIPFGVVNLHFLKEVWQNCCVSELPTTTFEGTLA